MVLIVEKYTGVLSQKLREYPFEVVFVSPGVTRIYSRFNSVLVYSANSINTERCCVILSAVAEDLHSDHHSYTTSPHGLKIQRGVVEE